MHVQSKKLSTAQPSRRAARGRRASQRRSPTLSRREIRRIVAEMIG